MLEKLFARLAGKDNDAADAGDTAARSRIAFAALLVEAARADEIYSDKEKALIASLLKRQFGLDDADALALRSEGEAAQDSANDLYRFSSTVKNGLSADEKVQLIEAMWEVILSDDARDPYEDMVVRRLAGLIYMDDQQAQEARRRVETRLAAN